MPEGLVVRLGVPVLPFVWRIRLRRVHSLRLRRWAEHLHSFLGETEIFS